jgi:hypothetical protein
MQSGRCLLFSLLQFHLLVTILPLLVLLFAGKFLVEYALYNYRPVPEGEGARKLNLTRGPVDQRG